MKRVKAKKEEPYGISSLKPIRYTVNCWTCSHIPFGYTQNVRMSPRPRARVFMLSAYAHSSILKFLRFKFLFFVRSFFFFFLNWSNTKYNIFNFNLWLPIKSLWCVYFHNKWWQQQSKKNWERKNEELEKQKKIHNHSFAFRKLSNFKLLQNSFQRAELHMYTHTQADTHLGARFTHQFYNFNINTYSCWCECIDYIHGMFNLFWNLYSIMQKYVRVCVRANRSPVACVYVVMSVAVLHVIMNHSIDLHT